MPKPPPRGPRRNPDRKPDREPPRRPPSAPRQDDRPERRHDDRSERRSGPPKPEPQWVWGLHPVRAALTNKRRTIKRLLATPQSQGSVAPLAKARQVEVEIVEPGRIGNLMPPDSVHQGVAALLAPMEAMDIQDAVEGTASPRRVVVLDQVTDPHNIGAILRSAAAFGVAAVIVQDRHTPQVSGIVAKAASGAAEIVPLVRVTNIARALEELEEMGFQRIGLADEATGQIGALDRTRDLAIVLGAEGDGMRRLTRENCDVLVALPTKPEMPSLNVSNACAVALFAVLP
jgi:23S rRNA (guanosine2251-2'-O)-methyltransferase